MKPTIATETDQPGSVQRLVSWRCYDGGFWLRILGRGISVVNRQKHPPLFSERNGFRRVRRIGKWGVEWLPSKAPVALTEWSCRLAEWCAVLPWIWKCDGLKHEGPRTIWGRRKIWRLHWLWWILEIITEPANNKLSDGPANSPKP